MNNENTITLELTPEEAEELYFAIYEQEDIFRSEYRDPSTSPERRRVQKERFNLAHSLRLRMELALDGQSTPPTPLSNETFPMDAVTEFYDLVYRSFGLFSQAAGHNGETEYTLEVEAGNEEV